jgi:hypothetical protein
VQELRWIIGQLLYEELQTNSLAHLCDCATRLNRRKEQARFYCWKKRKRLAPRKKQLQS